MTAWSDRIGLEHPLVQAGMGGGLATARLAGVVSAAGALGTVGIMPVKAFEGELRDAVAGAHGKPVAANLLLPFVRRGHLTACLESGMRVVVLHGGFDAELVRTLHQGDIEVLQQIGTVEQAEQARALGADGVIVQGVEAGGHTYAQSSIQEAYAAVRGVLPETMPVLAAGGVSDGADARRLLDFGADAVVAGTRFLATSESCAHPGYKQALLDGDETLATMLFGFGWPMRHRVLRNAATDRWCRHDELGPRPVQALSHATAALGRALPLSLMAHYPKVQQSWLPVLTPGPALEGGGSDRILSCTPLYAGQGVGRIHELMPAAEVVAALTADL